MTSYTAQCKFNCGGGHHYRQIIWKTCEGEGRKSFHEVMINTVQDLMVAYDKHKQIDVAVLDSSKAFDVVPHQRLLEKLQHYGINGHILMWISEFLFGRTQCVVVDGAASSWSAVESGVPQGTVLGPLLFLLYINDLPDCVKSEVRLFADDCLLYRTIEGIPDQLALQSDLTKLQQRTDLWGMQSLLSPMVPLNTRNFILYVARYYNILPKPNAWGLPSVVTYSSLNIFRTLLANAVALLAFYAKITWLSRKITWAGLHCFDKI